MKMLEEEPVDIVLLEYESEALDTEDLACQLKQCFPNTPIILLSAYASTPERILWLVDDYVMRSEISERLLPTVDRGACQPRASELRQLPSSRPDAA